MSGHAHDSHAHHGHDHGGHAHGDHGHGDGGHSHGTYGSYLTGFILSVILTAIPFWLVMNGVLDNATTIPVILGLGLVQILVHMVFFLHMNTKSEGGWTMLAMIFTVIVVVIMISGSLWVMYHLNANMMPGMIHDPSKLP